MRLSAELISQFAKVTNDKSVTKKESTSYGTIVTRDDVDYVHIDGAFTKDGSVILIPLTATVSVQNGDRVIVSIRNHMAVVTGNLTNPSTTVEHVTQVEKTISKEIQTNYAQIDSLSAAEAEIEKLKANDVLITGTLESQNVVINGKLDAEVAEITYAKIEQVDAYYGKFDTLRSDYAVFKETTTNELYADVAEIEKLIFGSAGGDVIQTSFANAVIAQLGNAQIKSAMIQDIVTNEVTIKSSDGRLVISDDTIQISDSSRVRVQIGKDASNDYSISVWDDEGNLMFSKGGITDAAIKEAIIRDDMVASNANISAGKIFVSDVDKTLDVAFREMTTEVTEMGETITSQGAEITALKDSIETKVWQEDINTATGELDTKYTELSQDVDSISATVASHTVDLAETQSLADDTNTRLTVTESLVQQLSDSISMLVTDENGTSLMTQTEDGWTFSTAEIQDMINSTAEDLHNLTEEVGDTNATVDILKQGLNDLGVISEYVKIGTHEGEPCIELGEGDSDFKLLVTNTRILFMDGSDVPAYITNKSLYIKKAVIEEELHQGNWVWKARSNGNLGLQWKGSD